MNRMKYILYAILVLSSFFSDAQTPESPFDTKEINFRLIENLILKHINHARDSLSSKQLIDDNTLHLAANLQSNYCKKISRLSHYQNKKRFKTVRKRVTHFDGVHESVAENLAKIKFGTNSTYTYNSLARQFVDGWIKSKGHFKNLSNPIFDNSGVSVIYDKSENTVYVAQVFGTTPIEFEGYKSPAKAYSLTNELNTQQCQDCQKFIDTIAAPWIEIDNGIVYIKAINNDELKVLFNRNYYFTCDLILRSQFACGEDNVLHSSQYHDGYLVKPVSFSKIQKNNIGKGKILISPIGTLPFSINEQYETNLKILYKPFLTRLKQTCITFIPSPAYGYNLQLMPHSSVFNLVNLKTESVLKRNMKFTIPFEKNKYEYTKEDIKPMIDSISLNENNIVDIRMYVYASVEGSKEVNLELQQKRAKSILNAFQSYQFDSIKTFVKTSENWKAFRRDIKRTPMATLAKLRIEEIREILKQDSIVNKLEPMFKRHRKAVIYVRTEEKIKSQESISHLMNEFSEALEKPKVNLKRLEDIQAKLHTLVVKEHLSIRQLESVKIPGDKEHMRLLLNRLALKHTLYDEIPSISDLNMYADSVKKHPDLLYDIYGYMLQHWYNYPLSPVIPFNEMPQVFRYMLNKKKISEGEFYKTMINFKICEANYYHNILDFIREKKSTRFVFSYYKKARLAPKDALILANFLVYHYMVKDAARLLRPYTELDHVEDDLLFYYLSVALFTDFNDNDPDFEHKMKMGLDADKLRFCKLYGHPAITFQLMRKDLLKSYYCENCNDLNINPEIESIIGDDEMNPKLLPDTD